MAAHVAAPLTSMSLRRVPHLRCVPSRFWAALSRRGMNPQAYPTPGGFALAVAGRAFGRQSKKAPVVQAGANQCRSNHLLTDAQRDGERAASVRWIGHHIKLAGKAKKEAPKPWGARGRRTAMGGALTDSAHT